MDGSSTVCRSPFAVVSGSVPTSKRKPAEMPKSVTRRTSRVPAGAFLAIAAVMFREAILAINSGNILFDASWSLSCTLGIQSIGLVVWFYIFNRLALINCLKLWRVSIWGGLFGALASQFWFLGFALTSAANVTALGLIEIFFAHIITWRLFVKKISFKEIFGILIIIFGITLLFVSQQRG